MTYRAWLSGSAIAGQRDALLRAFLDHRVLEDCRAAIPGFLGGELLVSEDDPDALCVTVEWADKKSFEDWQASPIRAAQGTALGALLRALAPSQLFRRAHAVPAFPGSSGKP